MTEENKTIIIKPVETEEIKAVKESTRELVENALSMKVNNIESFSKSADIRGLLNKAKRKIKETFKPIIDKNKAVKKLAVEALQEANALEEKALYPFDQADKHLASQRTAFTNEQDRLRRIEEQKLREKAEKAAAKEREKLRIESEKAREKARQLEEDGKAEQAKAELEKAEEKEEQIEDVYVAPVAAERKVESISRTDNGTMYNKTELVIHLPESEQDIIAFCQAVVDNKWPTSCVKFAMINIKSYAKTTGKKGKVGGVFIEEKITEVFKNK